LIGRAIGYGDRLRPVGLVAYLNGLDAHAALVVYHNWANRLVPSQPRTIRKSRAFEQNPLTAQRASDLALLIADIEQGKDLRKYLSRGIVRTPVKTPGGRRPDIDLLLNDWGVHHLHISSLVEPDGFVKRDGPLLFVSFTAATAHLIDIMQHGDWCRDHVLEVLASEWPNESVIYEMRSPTPTSPNAITEQQRANLRANGYNAAFAFNGKTFFSRGMMSGGVTMEGWLYARNLLHRIQEVEKVLAENPGRCAAIFEQHNVKFPDEPEFVFAIGDDGPSILEKRTGTCISLMA
jgi:hypothetical protein